MLQHGVHFGHQASRRHPKMDPFLYTHRNGISIIDLEKTKASLGRAAAFVRDLVAGGGTLMFVGTKRQARTIVEEAAQKAGMPFITDRWIGGLLTNFDHVRGLLAKLRQLKEDRASGDWTKYTKKEQLTLQKEIDRLERFVGGISSMEKLPNALYVIDLKSEKTAVAEARKIGIPIIGICDSNVNPTNVTYPIPANDDATKSIRFMSGLIAEAVQDGREQHDRNLAAAAKAAAAEVASVGVTST
jgi:small subunit ribosomal protein S2